MVEVILHWNLTTHTFMYVVDTRKKSHHFIVFRFFGCFDFEEVQRLHLSSFSFFCVATAFVISSALRFIKEVFISEVKKM